MMNMLFEFNYFQETKLEEIISMITVKSLITIIVLLIIKVRTQPNCLYAKMSFDFI